MPNQLPEHLWATKKGVGHRFLKALIALGALMVAGSLLFLAYTSIFDGTGQGIHATLFGSGTRVASGRLQVCPDETKMYTVTSSSRTVVNPGVKCKIDLYYDPEVVQVKVLTANLPWLKHGNKEFGPFRMGEALPNDVESIRILQDGAFQIGVKLIPPS